MRVCRLSRWIVLKQLRKEVEEIDWMSGVEVMMRDWMKRRGRGGKRLGERSWRC